MSLNFQRSWRGNRSGFTLVELLVGLSLWLLVTVSLTRIFQTTLKSRRHLEAASQVHQEARAMLSQVGREFRNSLSIAGVPWKSDTEELTFVTAEEAEIVKVTYRRDPRGTLRCLRQTLSPLGVRPAVDTPMTSSPAQVEWEYAYQSPEGVTWRSDWKPTPTHTIPGGLRVRLTMMKEETRPEVFTRTIFVASRTLPWAR